MKPLPELDPMKYYPTTYPRRMADPDAYLSNVTAELICELYSRGHTLTAIATLLHMSMPKMLSWMNATGERAAMLKDAGAVGAQALVDEAGRVLAGAVDGTAPLKGARDLADHLKWMAERLAPEKFGTKVAAQLPHAGVVFNIQMGQDMKTISIDQASLPGPAPMPPLFNVKDKAGD